jgi:hypothetical protein
LNPLSDEPDDDAAYFLDSPTDQSRIGNILSFAVVRDFVFGRRRIGVMALRRLPVDSETGRKGNCRDSFDVMTILAPALSGC